MRTSKIISRAVGYRYKQKGTAGNSYKPLFRGGVVPAEVFFKSVKVSVKTGTRQIKKRVHIARSVMKKWLQKWLQKNGKTKPLQDAIMNKKQGL